MNFSRHNRPSRSYSKHRDTLSLQNRSKSVNMLPHSVINSVCMYSPIIRSKNGNHSHWLLLHATRSITIFSRIPLSLLPFQLHLVSHLLIQISLGRLRARKSHFVNGLVLHVNNLHAGPVGRTVLQILQLFIRELVMLNRHRPAGRF